MLKELWKSKFAPSEVRAMLTIKYGGIVKKTSKRPLPELALALGDNDFCYAVLNRVSRSFAVVIQQLPEELKDAVMLFYLVLRGLDSIEDDMDIPLDVKVPHLRSFADDIFVDGFHLEDMGDSPDYRCLLLHFAKVTKELKKLAPQYQETIRDITQRMGDGMADFAETAVVDKSSDYNLYCHYVAGLVGIGLSNLFVAANLESKKTFAIDMTVSPPMTSFTLSNSMGLFLQKTNIIRDYLEDLVEGRIWWPRDVWSKYSPTLEALRDAPHSKSSRACLNHMVTDAMRHIPDALTYMKLLTQPQVFNFCAIPQVMAVATLALVYDNPRVYTGVVKVRKGRSCRMMLETNDVDAVYSTFAENISDIYTRVPHDDPSAETTRSLCLETLRLCGPGGAASAKRLESQSAAAACAAKRSMMQRLLRFGCWLLQFALIFHLLVKHSPLGTVLDDALASSSHFSHVLGYTTTSSGTAVGGNDALTIDLAAVATLLASAGYLMGYMKLA